jgi:hypothetical protein
MQPSTAEQSRARLEFGSQPVSQCQHASVLLQTVSPRSPQYAQNGVLWPLVLVVLTEAKRLFDLLENLPRSSCSSAAV